MKEWTNPEIWELDAKDTACHGTPTPTPKPHSCTPPPTYTCTPVSPPGGHRRRGWC
jgi:hypothetical protein